MNSKIKTHQMLHISLMAAVIALMAQIMFLIGTIPVTLQTCAVILTVLILRPREALLTLTVYVLLGAVGVPVFAGFKGGFGALLGPTGGYLIGFIPGAWLGAMLYQKMGRTKTAAMVAAAVCLLISYAAGLFWFMHIMHCGMKVGLMGAVLPYLPFEIIKMLIFIPVGRRVRTALEQQFPKYF